MAGALVPMVPEGLVLLTSLAFAVGVVRLGKQQCLVQELPAIEGLARVDVVCADKTGTLTENGMKFGDLISAGRSRRADGCGRCSPRSPPGIRVRTRRSRRWPTRCRGWPSAGR